MVTAPRSLPQLAKDPLPPVQPEGQHAFAQHGAPDHLALATRPRPSRVLTLAPAVKAPDSYPRPYSDPSNYLG